MGCKGCDSKQFGFGVQLGYGFPEEATNFCMIQGTDGIKYGATLEAPAFGIIEPGTTVVGQTVYAFTWEANGTFEMRFGDLGNEPVEDTDIIIHGTRGKILGLSWDQPSLRYTAVDLDDATALIAEFVDGEQLCGYVQIIPNLFISYNFDLQRGTA